MLYKKFFIVLLITVILSACTAPPPPAVSSEPVSSASSPANASSSVPLQEVPSPTAELIDNPMIYRYNGETTLYETLPFAAPPETVADLVTAAAAAAGTPVQLREITQQKGMVVVDFAPDSPPVIGMGSGAEASLLDSIAMTILRNHISAEWICYRAGGQAYESGHLLFGINEQYNPTPLRLVEDTADVYTEIRAQIPFPGLKLPFEGIQLPAPFVDDPISRELAQFLWTVGAPDSDAASPSALNPDFILEQAIMAAPMLDCSPSLSEQDSNYTSLLEPIAAVVEDYSMVLKEHVEQAAREIYGDTATLIHRDVFKWKWHETAGVYTPPHMGGGTKLPILFSYEKTGDRYRIECAFVSAGPGGYFDDDGTLIDETNMNNALQSRCQRREFVIERQPAGSYRFVSHRFLPA